MKEVPKATMLEKAAGSRAMSIGMSAAAAATPLILAPGPEALLLAGAAALLPALTGSIAGKRFTDRVEITVRGINEELAAHAEKIQNISDETFQLLNDIIVTVCSTTDIGKLDYLRRAAANLVADEDIAATVTTQLGRVVRDISFAEIEFIRHTFSKNWVMITDTEEFFKSNPNGALYKIKSPEAIMIRSLANLGVLVEPMNRSNGDPAITYEFSWLAAKLLALVVGPKCAN